MAKLDITTSATRVLGTAFVMRLKPYMMMMVPRDKRSSNQLMLFKALGMTFKAPIVPEASLAANVLDSLRISASVILLARLMVSLKSSSTRIPSPASSLRMF